VREACLPILLSLGVASCAPAIPASRDPGTAVERLAFVAGPAGRLRVSDGGRGDAVTVVFVHGLGASWAGYRGQLDHLRATRRAIAFDLRGHGESDAPANGDYAGAALAADVDAVARALALPRFVLVGHSMAGMVLSAYAGAHPEKLAGLVYLDAVGDLHRMAPEDRAAFARQTEDATLDVRAAFDEMLGAEARPATRAAVQASVAAMKPGVFVGIRRTLSAYAPAPDLARYHGPVACIDVARDDAPTDACALFPGVQRRRVRDVSHWLMLDAPAAVDAQLDEVLATMR
jgi:pimeloyl-ACP methyl ester carboxylesterase